MPLCTPGAPPPSPGGGLGEGRPGPEGGSGGSSAPLNGCGAGGKAPLGPPPRASPGSLGVGFAKARPAHVFLDVRGFYPHIGHPCPALPGVLNEAGAARG